MTRSGQRPGHERRRAGLARLVAAAVVIGTLAGCSGGGPAPRPSPAPHPATSPFTSAPRPSPAPHPATSPFTPTPAPGSVTWLLTRPALAQMLSDPAARSRLERSHVYELLQPGQRPLSGVNASLVVTFPSVGELRSALAARTLPAGTRAVLYDPETWSFTPPDEQRDPVRAAEQAAALAHAHGLKLIAAPALNLTTVMDPGGSRSRWRSYLNLGLARSMARVADVVELQAQSLERSQGTYAAFVRQAAAQARSANPRVTVLAGLSTNPPGAPVASHQLTAAFQAARSVVDGFWLNIPGQGARCPTCNPARPDIGVQVLTTAL